MNIIQHPSPNCNDREGHEIDMLVLHYTGMKSGANALDRMCSADAEVSAHYMVEEDGRIFQLVPEEMRAWHAGKSYWRGHTNINQRSIGVELVNPGHEFGYRDFPEVQMQSVIWLCKQILSRHQILARNVVGHSDVAPTRKEDPGEKFPWERLAGEGVGAWPNPGERQEALGKSEIQTTPAAGLMPAALSHYGYDVEDEKAAITAFQRHFRPKNLTGQWDSECEALLASLLKML